MRKPDRDKFIAECESSSIPGIAEATKNGPGFWMLGASAPKSDGMVGLATSPTQTVFFDESAIQEVRDVGGQYLIRISADANLLIREDHVTRLNPEHTCRCHDDEQEVMAKKGGGRRPPIIIDCRPVCSVETVCGPYEDPSSQSTIIVCWPQIVCRNPCVGVPT